MSPVIFAPVGSPACNARTVARLLPATIWSHVAGSFTPITWSSHQLPSTWSTIWLGGRGGAVGAPRAGGPGTADGRRGGEGKADHPRRKRAPPATGASPRGGAIPSTPPQPRPR